MNWSVEKISEKLGRAAPDASSFGLADAESSSPDSFDAACERLMAELATRRESAPGGRGSADDGSTGAMRDIHLLQAGKAFISNSEFLPARIALAMAATTSGEDPRLGRLVAALKSRDPSAPVPEALAALGADAPRGGGQGGGGNADREARRAARAARQAGGGGDDREARRAARAARQAGGGGGDDREARRAARAARQAGGGGDDREARRAARAARQAGEGGGDRAQRANRGTLATVMEMWGTPKETLAEQLGSAPKNAPRIPDEFLKWLWEKGDHGDLEFEPYKDRALLGVNAARLAGALSRVRPERREREQGDQPDRERSERALQRAKDAEAWREMAKQMTAAIGALPTKEIDDAIGAGRSVMMVTAHTGVMSAIRLAMNSLEHEVIIVGGADVANRQREVSFKTLPTGQGFAERFGTMTEEAKSSPKVVYMPIDEVPEGTDGIDVDFFGKPVKLAAQPAAFASATGALMLFASTHWNGTSVEVTVEAAPDANGGEDEGSYAARLNEFLKGKLEGFVTGAPEDMRLYGGVWNQLRQRSAA